MSKEYNVTVNTILSIILMKNELTYLWFCSLQWYSTFEVGQCKPRNTYAFKTLFSFFLCQKM